MNWIPFLIVNVVGNLVTALIFLAVMRKTALRTDLSREKKAKVLITTTVAGSTVLVLANLFFALQLARTGENLWGVLVWGAAIGFHISSAFTTRASIARKARREPERGRD